MVEDKGEQLDEGELQQQGVDTQQEVVEKFCMAQVQFEVDSVEEAALNEDMANPLFLRMEKQEFEDMTTVEVDDKDCVREEADKMKLVEAARDDAGEVEEGLQQVEAAAPKDTLP
jgi:hypothetical protein